MFDAGEVHGNSPVAAPGPPNCPVTSIPELPAGDTLLVGEGEGVSVNFLYS